MTFKATTVSDEKRLVRGEHYLLARTALRQRDEIHHRSWKILILAGPIPSEEIGVIRELMPKAKITAVDRRSDYVELAMCAGADSGLCIELTPEWLRAPEQRHQYDIINLDLCGPVSASGRQLVHSAIASAVTHEGIVMASFSYGRDVGEIYASAANDANCRALTRRIPEGKGAAFVRVAYLCFTDTLKRRLKSVMVYRGASMPMVSVLFQKHNHYWHSDAMQLVSWADVAGSDFDLALWDVPDVRRLYACPQERLESRRRSEAARKAVQTRVIQRAMEVVVSYALPVLRSMDDKTGTLEEIVKREIERRSLDLRRADPFLTPEMGCRRAIQREPVLGFLVRLPETIRSLPVGAALRRLNASAFVNEVAAV